MKNFSQNSVKIVLCGVVGSERLFKRVWDSSQQAKSVPQAIARTDGFMEKGTLFLCLLFLSIILDNRSYHDFLIIPTIPRKADNYGLLLKKGRDNFFKKTDFRLPEFRRLDRESRDNYVRYFSPYSFFKTSSSLTLYFGRSTPAITSRPMDFSIAFRFCSVSA